MRCLIALLALVAAASAASINAAEWLSFKAEHGKEYETIEEEEKRLQIFIQNRDYINKHNEEAANGEHSYELGMNQLGDLTNEEINARNGFLMKEHKQGEIAEFNNVGDLPKSVDWRTKGYVTPVKDQGNCGSCWAFSATGSLEGQWLKKDQKLISLSEQNLVDCSGKQGNLGCRGGLMDYAFTYIKANDGIDTETSYPYKAKNGKCVFKKESVGAKDTGFKDIKQGSEADLQNAIATVGPISIAMDASRTSFHFYKKGIYDDKRCSSSRLDHGILAVGYDATDSGDKYYIVKNSWGTSWGQKGYFWLARDDHNRCGCATAASYPTE